MIGIINSKWHATSIDDIKKTLHLDSVKTADEEKNNNFQEDDDGLN